MKELKNDRYLRALLRQDVDMTPVWMMRQAGRYLPEYRRPAPSRDFMSPVPQRRAGLRGRPCSRCAAIRLDAAILFSDILTVPDAMGWVSTSSTGRPALRAPDHLHGGRCRRCRCRSGRRARLRDERGAHHPPRAPGARCPSSASPAVPGRSPPPWWRRQPRRSPRSKRMMAPSP